MSDNKVIDKLLEDLKQKISEVQEIYNTLKILKKYGASFDLPDLMFLVSEDPTTVSTETLGILPDEFFNLTNNEATEKYLKKVGHAIPLDDIYNALVSGGIKFTGDGKKNLYVQINRATKKFVKIGNSFGLLEWYPKRKSKAEKIIEKIEEITKENGPDKGEEQ